MLLINFACELQYALQDTFASRADLWVFLFLGVRATFGFGASSQQP